MELLPTSAADFTDVKQQQQIRAISQTQVTRNKTQRVTQETENLFRERQRYEITLLGWTRIEWGRSVLLKEKNIHDISRKMSMRAKSYIMWIKKVVIEKKVVLLQE